MNVDTFIVTTSRLYTVRQINKGFIKQITIFIVKISYIFGVKQMSTLELPKVIKVMNL